MVSEIYEEYMRLAVEIIGISKDSEKVSSKFIESHSLPFLLLSDPGLNVIKAYDVWKEKNLYGKVTMGIVRTTFIIDEGGIIIKIFQKRMRIRMQRKFLNICKVSDKNHLLPLISKCLIMLGQ